MTTTNARKRATTSPANGKTTIPVRRPKRLDFGGPGKTTVGTSRGNVLDSGSDSYLNRILSATPTRGQVRIEWHSAVRGVVVPPNWSAVTMIQRINEFFPVRFSVADAQNLAVREALQRDFEWLLFLEDDVCPPPDFYIRLSPYLKEGPPIVSGLYYTKGVPSEPLLYRGRGTGAFLDWKVGQKVWVDGVPTGCILIHCGILRLMWNDSPEYVVPGSGERTREVFRSPARVWISPTGDVNINTGTSDLDFCERVIEGGYLKRAGWDKIARKRFPFLCDTNIRCGHVAPDGTMYNPPAPANLLAGARGEVTTSR